jgi:hypothetical protein
VPIALGWPQIALGIVVLVVAIYERRGVQLNAPTDGAALRGWVWLSWILLGLLVFMTTPASAAIWERIPLLRYSQFPWRLLGPASLLLAGLAGIGASSVERRIQSLAARNGWLGACVVVLVVYGIPWLYAPKAADPIAGNIADAQDFEDAQTGWIATSSFGEYLPKWSEELPDPSRLSARFVASEVIPRLEPSAGVGWSTKQRGD